MVINFPDWVTVTPCTNRTRTYWSATLGNRVSVNVKVMPLTKVRIISTSELHYIPTWVVEMGRWDQYFTVL